MSEPRRVVVTGCGLVTAIGNDESTVWAHLLAGRSGLRALTDPALAGNAVLVGGVVDATSLERTLPPIMRRADRAMRFAMECARQALTQAGLVVDGVAPEPQDVASIWGTGCGLAEMAHQGFMRFIEKGPKGMRPSTVPSSMLNALSAGISIAYRLTGTNYVVTSACTSATNAIGIGFRMIRDGHAEAVLCGGTDAVFDSAYYGAWNNLGVFSTIADPEQALRPFAADRAGTILGEGAGAILLESFEHAQRRGARLRGEILGYGESSDAVHITGPSVEGQAQAIRGALASAGVSPGEIGYINAHGTGTAANDSTESAAIRAVLGDAADSAPVGAMKSYFGHTLGASGAIETVCTLLALEHRVAPPNLNLERPDPACPVRLIGAEALPLASGLAMKNSFGFGGGNAVLVLRGPA